MVLTETGINNPLRSLQRGIGLASAVLAALTVGTVLGLTIVSPTGNTLFGVIGVSSILLVIAVNPFVGMLLWLTVVPFSTYFFLDIPMDKIPDITLLRAGAAFLILNILARAAARRMRLRWHLLDSLMVLAVIGIGVSIQDSVDRNAAGSLFLNSFLIPFAVYYCSRCLVSGWREMQGVIVALLVISLYLSIIAVYEQMTGSLLFDPGPGYMQQYTLHIRRLTSLLGNPAFFGVILGMVMPFVLWLITTETNRHRKFAYVGVFLLIVVGVSLTFVRAAWIGLAVALVVCAITNPDARKIAVIVGICGAIVWLLGWEMIQDQPAFRERIMAEGPIQSRLVMYSTAMTMIADNPLRGIGFFNFSHFSSGYLTSWADIPASLGQVEVTPHNTFLWVLISSGIWGFLPYLSVILGVVISSLRHVAHSLKHSRNHWLLLGSFWGAWCAFVISASSVDMEFSFLATSLFFLISGAVLGLLDRSDDGRLRRGDTPSG